MNQNTNLKTDQTTPAPPAPVKVPWVTPEVNETNFGSTLGGVSRPDPRDARFRS